VKPFHYIVPSTLDAALTEHGKGKAILKAGGIDLVDLMQERIETPPALLSIRKLPDLAYIREDGAGLRIGALTTLADMGRSDLLRAMFPGLAEAAGHAATPQVREQATLGGNLCQRPRCWYFRREEFPCLKKGGDTCYAARGENQYHAVFGGGPCHIVHPSNCAPPLVAADAEIVIRRAGGERTVKARDFFVLPRQDLMKENVLEPGEIIADVHIPHAPGQSATYELRERQSFDWPIASASVARVSGQWYVCLGAVAPVPWRSEAAEALLGKQDVTEQLAADAGKAAAEGATPLEHNAHKVPLVRAAVKRALMKAAGMEVVSWI